MTRVLVTGASGFIGRHVVNSAVERGYEVAALVRDRVAYGNPPRQVAVIEGDVRDPSAVRSALKGCRAVIHVAALYSFDSSLARLMYDINVGGTKNVLRMALEAGVDRFVYTGTVGTTAFSRKRLATEKDVAGPEAIKGDYKRTKYEAEQIVLQASLRGAPVIRVCPTTPIGPGDAKPTPTGKIVLDFMRHRMPAYVDTGLNFVHVKDVAEGHLLALERGEPGARYLLGNVEGNLTLRQAFGILSQLTSVPVPRVLLPHPAVLSASWLSTVGAKLLGRAAPIPMEAVRMSATRMWVDPSWTVSKLGMPQTSILQAFEEAVNWFAGREASGEIY
ncbi:MAG: NAD-dependent epimerase/dehydratase family protein [Chloroflexota bacterium]|nr:NAD-dependent epimerase/dehydratase family protein [Chloroflexota bacterium]